MSNFFMFSFILFKENFSYVIIRQWEPLIEIVDENDRRESLKKNSKRNKEFFFGRGQKFSYS